VLISTQPVDLPAAQSAVTFCKIAQIQLGIRDWLQAQFLGEVIWQGHVPQAMLLGEPDRRAVITLEGEPRRRFEFPGDRTYMPGKFMVL
jgi:hypothetical protein